MLLALFKFVLILRFCICIKRYCVTEKIAVLTLCYWQDKETLRMCVAACLKKRHILSLSFSFNYKGLIHYVIVTFSTHSLLRASNSKWFLLCRVLKNHTIFNYPYIYILSVVYKCERTFLFIFKYVLKVELRFSHKTTWSICLIAHCISSDESMVPILSSKFLGT